MKRILPLKNNIQEYAWGSYTAISELIGHPAPSQKPQAELWMGAHPKSPSQVRKDGGWVSLEQMIRDDPQTILGRTVSKKFNNRLPFLFKVLAAAQPLSIQAHPDKSQARTGFERENRLGIPLDAPNRNYRDDNHKPECICALTTFWALNGFRSIPEILSGLKQCCPKSLKPIADKLEKNETDTGLKDFFEALMHMDSEHIHKAIQETVGIAEARRKEPIFNWIIRLHRAYPSDIGVISPVILNLICLQPGQALLLPAGQLHAYLDGVGIELMANSDNVLRGGLTRKHVDVPELLNVLRFEQSRVAVYTPQETSDLEYVYPTHAEEFVLSVITIETDDVYQSQGSRNVEIILCIEGSAEIKSESSDMPVRLYKGQSILIPAAAGHYRISGETTLYKAAVPS